MDVKGFLQEITSSPDYLGQICGEHIIPARPPHYGELAAPLPEVLAASLKAAGIGGLYSHQAAAVDLVRRGKNIVVVTGTASGKTLCYNLPVLEEWLRDHDSRALYLFPTKALAQDQLKGLKRITEDWAQAPAMGPMTVTHRLPPGKNYGMKGGLSSPTRTCSTRGFSRNIRRGGISLPACALWSSMRSMSTGGSLVRRSPGSSAACNGSAVITARTRFSLYLGNNRQSPGTCRMPAGAGGNPGYGGRAPASEKHIILWNPALLEATVVSGGAPTLKRPNSWPPWLPGGYPRSLLPGRGWWRS